MKQTKFYLCLIAVLNCFSVSYAQDSSLISNIRYPAHPWALEFGVSTNLALKEFQGTAISLSRYISKNEKIRLGISPNFYSQHLTSDYYRGDTLLNAYSSTYKSGSINASLQYLRYEEPTEDFSLFFAAGPITNILWQNPTSDPPVNIYSIGLLGSCGFEWFFAKRISIHSEYGLTVKCTWSKTNTSTYSGTNTTWEVNAQGVLFGLSTYF
jgi:hypothetical protein